MSYYCNGRFYEISNDDDYNKMFTSIEERKKELKTLKGKLFKNQQTYNDISFISADILGAEQAMNEYKTEKNFQEKKKAATLFSFTKHVAGVSYRKDAVNKAIRFIDQEAGLDKYEGLKNKEIEDEGYEKVYKYAGFSTSNFDLELEPENEFDPKAVKVIVDSNHIGYLPKEISKMATYYLTTFKCKLTGRISIIGGPYKEFNYVDDKVQTIKSDFGFEINCTILDNEKMN